MRPRHRPHVVPGALAACAAVLLAVGPGLAATVDSSTPAVAAGRAVVERRGYVDTPLGQVHYRSLGDGAPVLLLHQTPWYAVEFANAAPLLAHAGFRVLAPDTPGFGHSPSPPGRPVLEEYADALAGVLGVSPQAPAVVVGHHTGAALAALLAARHPQRVRCVVLHGLPLYTDAERAERIAGLDRHGASPLAPDGSHLARHFATVRERIMHGHGSLAGVQWSTLAYFVAPDRDLKAYRALFEHRGLESALRAIRAPTLLLVDPDDMLLDATRRARVLRPEFAYAELSGGGSHVIYDRPDEWSKAVLDFVAGRCARDAGGGS